MSQVRRRYLSDSGGSWSDPLVECCSRRWCRRSGRSTCRRWNAGGGCCCRGRRRRQEVTKARVARSILFERRQVVPVVKLMVTRIEVVGFVQLRDQFQPERHLRAAVVVSNRNSDTCRYSVGSIK